MEIHVELGRARIVRECELEPAPNQLGELVQRLSAFQRPRLLSLPTEEGLNRSNNSLVPRNELRRPQQLACQLLELFEAGRKRNFPPLLQSFSS